MNCTRIMEMVYENSGSMPILMRIQIWLHALVCPDCALQIERFEASKSIMQEDFFPQSPGFEDKIMAKIEQEEIEQNYYAVQEAQGGLSTKGWVIAGLIIFISFVTAFFGLDFQNIARDAGTSFLLPMGITIGIILTTYGAIFIGSHLKELTERFGL